MVNAADRAVCGWGEWKGLHHNLKAGFSNAVTHFSCTFSTVLIHSIHLLTYLLTPRSRVLFEKLAGFQLVKKFPTLYGTRRFITAFTSARHLCQSWASSIQSIPSHPTSWRSIVILLSHLRLGLPGGLFPSGLPTKTLYTLLLSPISAPCPSHLILFEFITRTFLGEEYRLLSSSLCSFLHSIHSIFHALICIICIQNQQKALNSTDVSLLWYFHLYHTVFL